MTGLSLSLNNEQRCECEQRVITKLTLKNIAYAPFSLISKNSIVLTTSCPVCGARMTERQIKKGWRNDPYDFTTCCPKCGKRFYSHLKVNLGNYGHMEFPYLCKIQLVEEVRKFLDGKSLTKKSIKDEVRFFANAARHWKRWYDFVDFYYKHVPRPKRRKRV